MGCLAEYFHPHRALEKIPMGCQELNLEVRRWLCRQLLQECAVLYITGTRPFSPSPVPASDSSVAAAAIQSKSALSTSLLSQSAIAPADSSSTFCLFPSPSLLS